MKDFRFTVKGIDHEVYMASIHPDGEVDVTWDWTGGGAYGIGRTTYPLTRVEEFLAKGTWFKVEDTAELGKEISFSDIRKGDKIRVEFNEVGNPYIVEAVAEIYQQANSVWRSPADRFIVAEKSVVQGGGDTKIFLLERTAHKLEGVGVGTVVAFWMNLTGLNSEITKLLYVKTAEDGWVGLDNNGKFPEKFASGIPDKDVIGMWDGSDFRHHLVLSIQAGK